MRMKGSLTSRLVCVQSLLGRVVTLAITGWLGASPGATLEDFGFERLHVSGQAAIGSRPLLVIVGNFKTGVPLAHDNAYYRALFFGPGTTNVADYFSSASNGKFTFSPAGSGVVGPISLTPAETLDSFAQRGGGSLYLSNVVARTMLEADVGFPSWDRNGDGRITHDELSISFVHNDPSFPVGDGGTRDTGPVHAPGVPVTYEGSIAVMGHVANLATHCHELSHVAGCHYDLYGADENLSGNLTLMSGTLGPEFPSWIVHPDPLVKMHFGWTRPWLYSLRSGGRVRLPAAQLSDSSHAVLLYDESHGLQEFFMLEYRRRSTGPGIDYDHDVSGDGMVLWHVALDGSHEPLIIPRVDSGPYIASAETRWRRCNKCEGLHWIGASDPPVFATCPEGDLHNLENSSPYIVVRDNASVPGQQEWRRCKNCRMLFYGPNEAASACPVGGTHDSTGSANYSLVLNVPNTPGQAGWKWCSKCQGLFYGPNEATSKCARDGGTHSGSSSGNYSVLLEGQNRTVFSEGSPNLARGRGGVWTNGMITPNLRWLDGTVTQTRIEVRPFSAGDDAITVEWLGDVSIWVDFRYSGDLLHPEFGTFDNPFNTVAEGLGALPWGGTLKFKPGQRNEAASFTRRMTLVVPFGPATIGRN